MAQAFLKYVLLVLKMEFMGAVWKPFIHASMLKLPCGDFKLCLPSLFYTKVHCVHLWGLRNVLKAFSFHMKHLQSWFWEEFETYIVYIHVYLLAVFFFFASVELLHIFCMLLPPTIDQWNSIKPWTVCVICVQAYRYHPHGTNKMGADS